MTRVPSGLGLKALDESSGRDVGTGVAAPAQGQMRPAWPPSHVPRNSHAKAHGSAVGYRRQHRSGGGRRAQLRVRGALSETTNPAFKARVMGFIDSVDTMIVGVNAQAKGYWPYADDQGEYGEKLNLTKFVASSRLDDAPWGDFPAATVTRDPVVTIRELKDQSGKDIWLWGSLELMHSMLDAGVVDEVWMPVRPASRGKGTRVFRGSAGPEVGRGHPFREQRGTPALRDQEVAESPHPRRIGRQRCCSFGRVPMRPLFHGCRAR